jgi:hypothetical protein
MNDAPLGTMSHAVGTYAESISIWTRMLAVAMITVGGLTAIVAIFAAASAQAIPVARPLVLAMALTYLIAAVVSMGLGIVLHRYGRRMQVVAEKRQVAALVDALEYESLYWRITGILVVFSFAASVLSSAVPSFQLAAARSRMERTARDMETIGAGLEGYALREYQYPNVKTIDDLARVLEPRYLTRMPRRDGQDQPFKYVVSCSQNQCGNYQLSASSGEVFSDGHFTKRPDEQ